MSDRTGKGSAGSAAGGQRDQGVLFTDLLRTGRVKEFGEVSVTLARDYFVRLLEPQIRQIRFDPEFYRRKYVDLAEAEAKGLIKDLHEHFIHFGYFEARLPCLVEVDGAFYSREYPDVALAILEGRVASAQAHYEVSGYGEGRIPRKGWTFAEMLTA